MIAASAATTGRRGEDGTDVGPPGMAAAPERKVTDQLEAALLRL